MANMLLRQLSNLLHLGFIQLGTWISRTQLPRLTILSIAVVHIVLMRAEKKMIWIHARSVIALMEYLYVVWNWAKVNLPRYALSVGCDPINDQAAVPICCKASCPVPALIGATNVYLFPEFFFDGFFGLGFAPMSSNKSNWLASNLTAVGTCYFCKRGWLSTTAIAEFWCELTRGIIVHVESFLSRFSRSQDAPTSLAISIPFTRSIVAQMVEKRNAPVAELSASPC